VVCSALPVQTSPLAARLRISKDGYFAASCWSWNWLLAPTRNGDDFGYVGYSGGDVALGVRFAVGRDGAEVVGVKVGDHAGVYTG
jgi:hypothetical protein